MKIEKWIYKGKEIDVPILENDEIETNEEIELDKTKELTEILNNVGENNE